MEPLPALLGPKLFLERMGPSLVRLGISPPILRCLAHKMGGMPPGEIILASLSIVQQARPPTPLGPKPLATMTPHTLVCLDIMLPLLLCTALKMEDWPLGALIPVNLCTALLDLHPMPPGHKLSLERMGFLHVQLDILP